ncbi:FHA domain-containing protein [Paratissierella segnis]|uniref:FHA domain-containing protein n=1 Tax=Paratissierella segnis TaxID=2763679 RepID=A0A926IK68_9FIRM|nr:FHA domain-containing protein [Paratissierella segnis]MBC8588749.1 FHA domain-containing protein [Paratissierella segnis]
MFNILSLVFKYIFIIIIYLFIFSIIRLIYLDIGNMNYDDTDNSAYLKLINKMEDLPYKISEYYTIDEKLTFGRNQSNDIYIKDPFVSKRHFQIIEDEGDYYLEDLDSANGTYLNQEKIEDVVKLRNGDIIKISNIEFLFVNK